MPQNSSSVSIGGNVAASHVNNLVTDVTELFGRSAIRQTALSGATSAGQANFISAGSGLACNLAATTTPLVVSFAAGFSGAAAALDYVGTVSADATSAWSGLTASSTNFLYLDRNTSTGALTYGASTLAPIYSAEAPTATITNIATAAQAISGGTNASFPLANAFDGGAYNHSAGWESSQTTTGVTGVAYIGQDFGAGNTRQIKRAIVQNSGTGSPISSTLAQWSTDGSSWTTIQTNSMSTTDNGVTVIDLADYTAARYFRLLANANPSSSGWRLAELTLHEAVKDGQHWFDLSAMVMKVRASGAWSTVQRVFLGECVTDATSVTSAITYALRGQYDSGFSNVVNSTTYTRNHYLGVPAGLQTVTMTLSFDLGHNEFPWPPRPNAAASTVPGWSPVLQGTAYRSRNTFAFRTAADKIAEVYTTQIIDMARAQGRVRVVRNF